MVGFPFVGVSGHAHFSGDARSVLSSVKGDIAYYHGLYRCRLAFSQNIPPVYAKRRESRIYRPVSASWSSIGNSSLRRETVVSLGACALLGRCHTRPTVAANHTAAFRATTPRPGVIATLIG